MTLSDYLFQLARIWCEANLRTLVALGGVVAGDGKFFARLEAGGQPRTGTFEKFLLFFRDGANWPDMVIPLAAAEMLDQLGNIAAEASASPDNDEANIGGAIQTLSRETRRSGAVQGRAA